MRGWLRTRPDSVPTATSAATTPQSTNTGQSGTAPVAEATTTSNASASERAAASAA